jgi:hypothetical protein
MPDHQNSPKKQSKLVVRFGDELLESGFTALPNILLRYQGELQIKAEELNFIVQIWYHWWDDADPYPALKSVARRMAKHEDSVRGYSRSLQKKRYLVVRDRQSKTKGQLTSEYDFSPLINRLKELWRAEQADRLAREVDWEIIPRGRNSTPSEDSQRGGSEDSQRAPSEPVQTEEYTGFINTQNNKDALLISNNIELQSQVYKNSSVSKFSKKQVKDLQNSDSDEKTSGDVAAPREGEPEPRRTGDYQPRAASTNGFTAIGEVGRLKGVPTDRKPAPRRGRTAPGTTATARAGDRQGRGGPDLPEPPEWLTAQITRLSDELHDYSHAQGNVGQAHNLFLFTGAEEGRFRERLNEAKRLTLKYDIEKKAEGEAGEYGLRNKMPYFFKVLRDVLGLKDIPASETKPVTARRKGRGKNVNEQFYSP